MTQQVMTLRRMAESKDTYTIRTQDAEGRELTLKAHTIHKDLRLAWARCLELIERLVGWRLEDVSCEVAVKRRRWSVKVTAKAETATHKTSRVTVNVPLLVVGAEEDGEQDEAQLMRCLRSMDGLIREHMFEMAGLQPSRQLSLFDNPPRLVYPPKQTQPHRSVH